MLTILIVLFFFFYFFFIFNDRNTTHVVFKDGLRTTYNKAKGWNIPIVSVRWVEACRKHLVLMDPKEYTIQNVDIYENPDLYSQRSIPKVIQFK